MLQLKRAVENMVAPIPAEESLKNKYRLELYSHLHELYEEERPRHEDYATALDAALERLGEPKSLRAEFLKSLSVPDRWVGRFEYAITCQPGDSVWRHSFRLGGICFVLYMTAVYGLLFPIALVLKDESSDMIIGAALFGIVMGLNLPTFMIVISVLQVQTRKIVGSASTVPIKYLRMAGASALSALPIWLVGLGPLYIGLTISVDVLGEAHASVAMLEHVRTSFMPRWCSVFTVSAVLLPPLSALELDRNIPDWPYAE